MAAFIFHPVVPSETDEDQLPEIAIQREKWNSFLRSHDPSQGHREQWLWQYWREESRPSSQLLKNSMQMFSPTLRAQKQLKTLIRNGIPPEHRGLIWWTCSGAEEKWNSSTKEQQFGTLVQRLDELKDSHVAFEIKKDLKRTFPDNAYISSPVGIRSLEKVLLAYALRNPQIGYCQAMNYICAVLLLHMCEEKAFWVMATMIEDILPNDYYLPNMMGSRTDQQVFQSCIAWKLPHIHSKIKETKTGLEPVTMPWFLCIFVNTLPLYTACRVWDCLFWEGAIILFRVGLACLKLKEKNLSACREVMGIYNVLKCNHKLGGTFDMEVTEVVDEDEDEFEEEEPPSGAGEGGGGLGAKTSLARSPSVFHFLGASSKVVSSKASVLFAHAFAVPTFPRDRIDLMRLKLRAIISEADSVTNAKKAAVAEKCRLEDEARAKQKEAAGGGTSSPTKAGGGGVNTPDQRNLMRSLMDEGGGSISNLLDLAERLDEGIGAAAEALAEEMQERTGLDDGEDGLDGTHDEDA